MSRSRVHLLGLALAFSAAPFAAAALAAPETATPEQTATAALKAAPVWDGHNDVPEQLRERRKDMIADFDFRDTTHTGSATADRAAPWQAMHTDLTRLRQGRVGAQFWSVYVSADLPEPQAVQATLEQIDLIKRLIARYPKDMALCLTAADVEKAIKDGRSHR